MLRVALNTSVTWLRKIDRDAKDQSLLIEVCSYTPPRGCKHGRRKGIEAGQMKNVGRVGIQQT